MFSPVTLEIWKMGHILERHETTNILQFNYFSSDDPYTLYIFLYRLGTSLSWSWKLLLWHHPCSVPRQESFYSLETSATFGATSKSLLEGQARVYIILQLNCIYACLPNKSKKVDKREFQTNLVKCWLDTCLFWSPLQKQAHLELKPSPGAPWSSPRYLHYCPPVKERQKESCYHIYECKLILLHLIHNQMYAC